MISYPPATVQDILARLEKVRPAGENKWTACCPAHEDSKPSLSITVAADGKILLRCFAGCAVEEIVRAIGLTMRDLFSSRDHQPHHRNGRTSPMVHPTSDDAVRSLERRHGKPSARWTYHDAHGEPVGVVLRWSLAAGAKEIRPIAKVEGGWSVCAMPEPRPLYRLPDLLRAPDDMVLVVEGEKCADIVVSLGFIATTSVGGAKAPRKTDWSPLRGRLVAIVPDHDIPGAKYATTVARMIGGAGEVRIVDLPGLQDGEDIEQFVAARRGEGKTDGDIAAEIRQLADAQHPIDLKPHIRKTEYEDDRIQPKKARTLEPYRPFPVEALPEPIAEYVKHGARALGCDPAYIALPALSVVASAIGNTRTIQLKRGWYEPSVAWSVIIGDSGTLKSPACKVAVDHLYDIQAKLIEQYKVDLAAYEDTDHDDEPDPPVLPRVICSDTTIEKLAEILEDNPRGIPVTRDELAGWLGSFTRYKGKTNGTDLPSWLEFFRAGSVLIDRKTGERRNIYIRHAAVSVTGGMQPGIFARSMTQEFLDCGLAARLLPAMPTKIPKKWTDAEIAPEVETAYHNALDRLRALDFDVRDGKQIPHTLRLSPAAKAAWVSFYNAWALDQNAVEGVLAAAFAKLEAYAARFALLHHVVSRIAAGEDDRIPVEPASIYAGETLCRWFAHEGKRVYTMLAETDEQRDTRQLVDLIQRRGGQITVRDLMRANCRRYPGAEKAEKAMKALVESGLATWVTNLNGGTQTRAIRLSMTHDTYDTGDDTDDDTQTALS